jgi:hypothetical protein
MFPVQLTWHVCAWCGRLCLPGGQPLQVWPNPGSFVLSHGACCECKADLDSELAAIRAARRNRVETSAVGGRSHDLGAVR